MISREEGARIVAGPEELREIWKEWDEMSEGYRKICKCQCVPGQLYDDWGAPLAESCSTCAPPVKPSGTVPVPTESLVGADRLGQLGNF